MTPLLLFGDTERSAALRHEVPLAIIDPLLFAEVDGRRYVLTSALERDRVARVLPDAELLDWFELGLRERIEAGTARLEAEREIVAQALSQIGVTEALIPGEFPLGLGDCLRLAGVALTVDDDVFLERRRAKSGAELDGIRAAQAAAEAGMAAARELLGRADADEQGRLCVDGELLLAEDVRAALRAACASAGASCPPDVIVASAWSGYGHDPGAGPLPAGLPIVVDLWPREERSACWADMTRTFIVGEPAAEHAEVIDAAVRVVGEVHVEAIEAIRPGVSGRELYDLACDRFEAAGIPTQRSSSDPNEVEGFQFALGHGVGLEIHEAPWLGLSGRETLVPGDVLAIEPGVYRRGVGEVRFEDLVLVTESGAENLTRFSYELRLDGGGPG